MAGDRSWHRLDGRGNGKASTAEESVVVVTAADANYALPLAVMGRSLIDHLQPGRRLILYILDGGMRARERRAVSSSWDLERTEVRWVKIASSRLRGVPSTKRFGPVTYFRLLIPEILPRSMRRAIYIDADTLVLDDIAKLWRYRLRGHPLGAVQDPLLWTFGSSGLPWDELEIPPHAEYFNSGVLLMDLALWRRESFAYKVFEFARDHTRDIMFPDQDALNGVFAGRWRRLHPRWNCALEQAERNAGSPDVPNGLDYADAVDRPGILHYIGGPKPWQQY